MYFEVLQNQFYIFPPLKLKGNLGLLGLEEVAHDKHFAHAAIKYHRCKKTGAVLRAQKMPFKQQHITLYGKIHVPYVQ